jgi:gliding motility-associated protein GldC
MKKSEIKFIIELDDKNIPDKILWEATDGPSDRLQSTDAISIAIWDHVQLNTMRMDLWTKEMPALEMKRFFIEAIGGMADTLENSTGDNKMAEHIRACCKTLVSHVKELEEGK